MGFTMDVPWPGLSAGGFFADKKHKGYADMHDG